LNISTVSGRPTESLVVRCARLPSEGIAGSNSTYLVSSIRGVKKKQLSRGWIFLAVEPAPFEQDCRCLPSRGLGAAPFPQLFVFLSAVFISLTQRSQSVRRPQVVRLSGAHHRAEVGSSPTLQTYSSRGAVLYRVALPDIWRARTSLLRPGRQSELLSTWAADLGFENRDTLEIRSRPRNC
jgi:hypothetical protein